VETRCAISVVVNANRWQSEGDLLADADVLSQRWSLAGLIDYVQLVVGTALGRTFEQIDLVDLRFCRARPCDVDAEAVASGFTVVVTPHIDGEDSGVGLALETIESVQTVTPDAIVVVGAQSASPQLRQKLEAAKIQLFEFLLLPTGKTQVSTARVFDLREKVRLNASDTPESALSKPPILPEKAKKSSAKNDAASGDNAHVNRAANSILGTVKQVANGYGIVTRKDGLGDVQFLAAHVAPPGFQFVEVGDTLRFDVVELPSGKLQAKRVSRI
jgi:cold shock CspA family protein